MTNQMAAARTLEEIKAALPAEARERMETIKDRIHAAKTKGGSWRVYIPFPGQRRASHLYNSYPTYEAALGSLSGMFHNVKRFAEIRHEA